jgi:type IV pilus assembly protein PilW
MKLRIIYTSLGTMPRRSSNQRGVTLVELLVGVTIGLLLALVASSTYLFSKQNFNVITETSQMEENGRFALNLLARYVQSTGFTMIDRKANLPSGALDDKISGCDFGYTSTAAGSPDFTCLGSAPTGQIPSAGLRTVFETDIPDTTKFQGKDCIGNDAVTIPITGSSPTYRVTSYFFVSTTTVKTEYGTSTMGQLSCLADSTPPAGAANFNLPQPIIPGIVQIAVGYLVPSATAPEAGHISKTAAAVATALEWPRVVAVDLCVVAKSVGNSVNDTNTSYTDCYGTALSAASGERYRTFRTTINLRNRTL